MKKSIIYLFLTAIAASFCSLDAIHVKPLPLEERKAVMNIPGMCSIRPANRWDEAIVTGNGTLGASVFGQPYKDKVVFNHERLFRPLLDERPLPPEISEALPEVRRMMREGNTHHAQAYWREVMAEKGHTGIVMTPSYHPAYSMLVELEDASSVWDYLRSVDFMTGEAVVRYTNRDGKWISKTFVSRADNVIVQYYTSLDGRNFNVNLKLVDQDHNWREGMELIETTYDEEWMTAQATYNLTDRGYEGVTRVICDGGDVEVGEDSLKCVGVKSVLMLTRIEDHDDFANADLAAIQKDLAQLPTDYDTLFDAHVALHESAMGRVVINLDDSDERYMSSEELIELQAASKEIIPAFLQKMFNMGRYTLLSSSGRYPPPLTSIWNGDQGPPWSADWTLDTNLNQQIAGANTCALPEALYAYLGLIEEIAPSWEVNAQNIYGFRGHMSGIRTSVRENYNTHFHGFPSHCWTAGAAWLIYPLYEYYLVTGDKQYLEDRVLPLMEKTVLFYEDFLTEYDDNGNYLFVPSFSPENSEWQSMNSVQDIAAAKQAIRNLIEAYQDLGIKPERVKHLQGMLDKMPPYLINEEGALKEWAYPKYKDHYDHRHMAHRYPVWPAHELNWEEHPEEMQAMRVAIEKRLPQHWAGHGFVVRAFAAARTNYPELFYQYLYLLMRYDYIERNLITRHNPNWAPNTDVLCGLPGFVAEALLYSKPGVIELLPAWSTRLPSGSIDGLRTRTQATVESLEWDLEQKEITATIRSLKDQWVTIFVRQGIEEIESSAKMRSSEHGDFAREVYLKKGEPVKLTVSLEAATNDFPVNEPSFTLEQAEQIHAERLAKQNK
ncbi:glycosyl hydrolase family 95 catalytic domain-containing protein [Rubellicoccus peritrichatus]|uniref:Glycoside hydrolase N-terminal domain-containing protein n=1 Tax=Rubellicoccus peritrichatus TaxID=3080537 RepID=A0AAQ3QV80_9BACT|nr:glycoside hydrolase N-terminal domain-containing protein [Puniceicoccus sp. CR14]WOO40607.1 glycoside hydrolase N-terminal domain-containing protein [Puniceicoccus sp. CR14]